MKQFFALLFLSFALYACPSEDDFDDVCIADRDPACICTREYDPVCGCDDVTYSNPCEAECSNIYNYTPGACPG